MKLPFFVRLVFNRYFFEKFAAVALLAIVAYMLDAFLPIFLMTFLFAFLFLDISEWALKHATIGIARLKKGPVKTFLFKMNRLPVMVTALYVGFIVVIIAVFSGLIPHILDESKGLVKEMPDIAARVQHVIDGLETSLGVDLGVNNILDTVFSKANIETTAKNIFENLRNAGIFLGKILISLFLSYVFIIDRTKIFSYLESMKRGNFAFLYHEYSIILGKIGKGFGLIFKAQAIIALANAILTTIGLILISLFHGGEMFPYITTIALTVLILGFVPVLGFLISSLPILLIGYNYGGVPIIIEICVMIAVVHAVESYYLNPKIVSSYMEFPVFVTFLILLLSEHLFGFVGLLIGVPLFYITIDLAKDVDAFIDKLKRVSSAIDTAKTSTKEAIHKNIRLSRSQGNGEE